MVLFKKCSSFPSTAWEGDKKKVFLFPKLHLGKEFSCKLSFFITDCLIYGLNYSKLKFLENFIPKFNFGMRTKKKVFLFPKLHLGKEFSCKLSFFITDCLIYGLNYSKLKFLENSFPSTTWEGDKKKCSSFPSCTWERNFHVS